MWNNGFFLLFMDHIFLDKFRLLNKEAFRKNSFKIKDCKF